DARPEDQVPPALLPAEAPGADTSPPPEPGPAGAAGHVAQEPAPAIPPPGGPVRPAPAPDFPSVRFRVIVRRDPGRVFPTRGVASWGPNGLWLRTRAGED